MLSKSKDMITRAIKSGINMKFKEFITFNDIKLENFIVDKFFHNIQDDLAIYMSDDLIEYFGYEGTFRKQKEKVNELINNNFSEHKNQSYWIYTNDDYSKYLKERILLINNNSVPLLRGTELYPPIDKSNGKAKTKHLIIMPEMFKEMSMLCNTDKGKQIRKYYIKMIDALHLYIEYQNKMELKTVYEKLDKITLDMIEERRQATEERIKAEAERIKAEAERIKAEDRHQESQRKADEERIKSDIERKESDIRFRALLGFAEDAKVEAQDAKEEVIIKIEELAETRADLGNVVNDRVSIKRIPENEYTYVVILKDISDIDVPYYVLRTQLKSINSRIKELRKKYTSITEIFRIYNPNANISWKSICDKYPQNDILTSPSVIKSNLKNWFSIKNMTEEQFKNKIIDMDNTERKNPKFI